MYANIWFQLHAETINLTRSCRSLGWTYQTQIYVLVKALLGKSLLYKCSASSSLYTKLRVWVVVCGFSALTRFLPVTWCILHNFFLSDSFWVMLKPVGIYPSCFTDGMFVLPWDWVRSRFSPSSSRVSSPPPVIISDLCTTLSRKTLCLLSVITALMMYQSSRTTHKKSHSDSAEQQDLHEETWSQPNSGKSDMSPLTNSQLNKRLSVTWSRTACSLLHFQVLKVKSHKSFHCVSKLLIYHHLLQPSH